MDKYDITGMSCAACSARVEKAVSAVPGVTSCSVSLLTNSMGVEGTADPKAIIKAVTDAGYGASPAGGSASDDAPADKLTLENEREQSLLKHRLILSVVFLLVLMSQLYQQLSVEAKTLEGNGDESAFCQPHLFTEAHFPEHLFRLREGMGNGLHTVRVG